MDGVVAQLVERLNGIQEVASSILVGSTILSNRKIIPNCNCGLKDSGGFILIPGNPS